MTLKRKLAIAVVSLVLVAGAGVGGWFLNQRREPKPQPFRATVRALVETKGKPDRVETWTVDSNSNAELEAGFAAAQEKVVKSGWDVVALCYGVPDARPGPELLLTNHPDLALAGKAARGALDAGDVFVRIVVIAGPGIGQQRMAKLLGVEVAKGK